MNRNIIAVSSVAALLLGSSAAFAQTALDGAIELEGGALDSYINVGGEALKTGLNECAHGGTYSSDATNNACEGIEEAAPEPAPAPAPAPAPEPVKKQPIVKVEELGGAALFDTNADTLNSAGEQAIADLLVKLEKYQEITSIAITGHTDDRGEADYNQDLSERRAASVQAFIQAAYPNVPVTARGMGETSPIATNRTPEGRQQNRRVEVEVTAKSITE